MEAVDRPRRSSLCRPLPSSGASRGRGQPSGFSARAPQPHSLGEPGICGFSPGTGMYPGLGGLLELLGRMKEIQKMEATDAARLALPAREEG